MFKNILKLLSLIFIFTFSIFTFNYYFSEKNINIVKTNRVNFEKNIMQNISILPVLPNNTNNVIEFNTGFENSNKQNTKRSFWDLFK